jgi:NAD(P)-dependent dehydrogenase (short-subunit alcohol dehydrogenase family)
MSVKGRTAVVTGSGRGIGKAIVTLLAANGARVVVNDINEENAENTAREIRAAGGEAIAAVANVATREGAEQLIGTVVGAYGGVDILVNNVGIVRDNLLVNMSEEDWDDVLTINLKSYFLATRTTVPHMIEQKYGRIVNIASRAWLGNVGQANYSAAKGGVVSMTRTLALELGRHQITANAVAPGAIDTPLIRGLRPDVQERLRQMQPTKSFGTPDDVARAVRFFADDDSGFITGQVLHVCGGKSVKSDW